MQQRGWEQQRTMTETYRCRCWNHSKRTYSCGWRSAVLLPIVVALMLANMAVATSAASSSSDFVMDGATTYCWEVDTSIYSNTVDSSVNMVSAEGDGCPLKLSIVLDSGEVYAHDALDVSWSAMKRVAADGTLETNAFGVTNLPPGLDRITQSYYEITASRLRTCPYGVDCNPVTTGSQLTANTTNYPLNFTDGLAVFHSSELLFDQSGDYTLLAHLILPSNTPTTKRYDYAVFLKVKVISRSSAAVGDHTTTPYSATEASGNSGLATYVIYILIIGGIVVAILIVIGLVTLRSKMDRNPESDADKQDSKKGRGMFGFSNTGIHSTGDVAVVSDGEAEEFAMLSMHEATISQDRGSTYLSARNNGVRSDPASHKKPSPIPFVGPVENMDRKNVLAENGGCISGDVTPQSVSIETPTTGRGNYTSLGNTPKNMPPKHSFDQAIAPGQIIFNDIMEDEVVSTSTRSGAGVGVARQPNLAVSTLSDVTDLNLTAVSERIKQHCAIAEQESASVISKDILTADDLRESETKGPMELSDLLASRVKK